LSGLRKLQQTYASRVIDAAPQLGKGVHVATVCHDDDCAIFTATRTCTCDPEIIFTTLSHGQPEDLN
jgi:hypothetical protein